MTIPLLAITVVSIAALTAVAWAVRSTLLPRLCPLCAGVAVTWAGLLAAGWAGFAIDLRLPALLLGGSVVGLASLGEKRMSAASATVVLLWKTLFVATGFATAYLLLASAWAGAAVGVAALSAIWLYPFRHFARTGETRVTPDREALLDQLKNCC